MRFLPNSSFFSLETHQTGILNNNRCSEMVRYGEIIRYKATLVAQGFTQVEGIDYKGMFA